MVVHSQTLGDEEIKSEIRHSECKGEHYFAQGTAVAVVVDDDTETSPVFEVEIESAFIIAVSRVTQ